MLEFLTVSRFSDSSPGFWYICQNERFFELGWMRLGAVTIGVKLGLLPVDHAVRLFFILFMLALDIKFTSGSALVVRILCFFGCILCWKTNGRSLDNSSYHGANHDSKDLDNGVFCLSSCRSWRGTARSL